jgi:DNA-binding HxlR family transcriptional regulator
MASPAAASSQRDAILGAVETIGDAWSWLILREAVLYGVGRFAEFQERLGISRATLSSRLSQLQRGGLLVRDESAPRQYTLTAPGEDFFGCLMVAQRWGDTWRPRSAAAVPVKHRGFRHRVSALLCCRSCGEPIDAHDVEAHRAEAPLASVSEQRWRTPDLELLERVRPCSIAHTLTVVGDRWSSLILRELFFGTHRFDDLQRGLGVGPNVLSARLRQLIMLDVVRKVEYQAWPVRHEYRLSDKGVDLYPIPLALAMWGRRWLPPAEREPRLVHKCGHGVRAVLCCGQCRREITRHAVEVAPVGAA